MFQGLVLLVDDEPIAAEDSMAALKQFVRPEQILYASSADEAIRLLDSRPVALVFHGYRDAGGKRLFYRRLSG